MADGKLTEQLLKARTQLRNEADTLEFSMLEQLWVEQKQLRLNVEAITHCLRKGGLLSDEDLKLEMCESQTTMSQSERDPAEETLQDAMYPPDYVPADKSVQDITCQTDDVPADVSPQDDKCQSECAPAHESLMLLLAARAVAACLTTSTTPQSICSLRQVSRSVQHSIDASLEQRLCVIGGVDQSWFRCSQEIVKAESLDAQIGSWEPLSTSTPLRVRHFNHAGAVLCGCIFICGGGFAPFNAVKCFNLQHKNWKKMRSMHASRNFPAAAAIGQHLYVCGGWDGKIVSSSCERFSPLRGEDGMGEWEYLPDMSLKRHTHAAVALRGQFFVCGGAQANMESLARSDVTKSAEAFSPLTGKWEQLPSMKEQRFFHAAAALGGIAYVLGGAGGKDGAPFFTPDTSVECYDPSTNLWSHSAPMLFQRQAHAATVLAGRLYVCGGYMEPSPPMAHVHAGHSVECFDPDTGTWEAAEPMQEGRAQFSIGVVSQLDQAARF